MIWLSPSTFREERGSVRKLDEMLGIFLLAVMVLAMGLGVVSRYFKLPGFFWVGEFVEYLYIWLAYVGAAVALRHGGHVGFEGLAARLPPPVRALVGSVAQALMAVFLVAVLVLGVRVVGQTADTPSSTLRIPMALVYAVIPLSALLMLVQMAEQLARRWGVRKEAGRW